MPDDSDNKLLEFLMKDKKEEGVRKDNEKKEDEERRLAEREEDAKRLEKFRDDIITTVKCEIKTEIQVAMEPIKRRQDEAEKEAEATNTKVDELRKEMNNMKKQLDKMEEIKRNRSPDTVSEPYTEDWNATENLPRGWRMRRQDKEHQEQHSRGMEGQATKLLMNARRVI